MERQNGIFISQNIDKNLDIIEYNTETSEFENLLQISSDAFPGGKPFYLQNSDKQSKISDPCQFISPVHKILRNNLSLYQNMFYFKNLLLSHIGQVILLFREWFPINYNREYIEHFIKNNKNDRIAIGCFINIDGEEYVIGKLK